MFIIHTHTHTHKSIYSTYSFNCRNLLFISAFCPIHQYSQNERGTLGVCFNQSIYLSFKCVFFSVFGFYQDLFIFIFMIVGLVNNKIEKVESSHNSIVRHSLIRVCCYRGYTEVGFLIIHIL